MVVWVLMVCPFFEPSGSTTIATIKVAMVGHPEHGGRIGWGYSKVSIWSWLALFATYIRIQNFKNSKSTSMKPEQGVYNSTCI